MLVLNASTYPPYLNVKSCTTHLTTEVAFSAALERHPRPLLNGSDRLDLARSNPPPGAEEEELELVAAMALRATLL